MKTLHWGIIGAGNIAKAFAKGVAASQTGVLRAIASRSQAKADAFAKEHGDIRAHGSYEALLADPDVHAVYIATPHPQHAEWAIKAAEAGKHLLVEKPIGLNHAEAMAIVEAARANGVFLMEAFMYRCHPQTIKLVELLADKIIGDVRMIQASFGFNAGFNPDSRLFNNDLGGGGILDVGGYPVSMVRLIAGVAMGKPFVDPTDVKAVGHLGYSGVDEWACATLSFPGDILAQVSTGVALNMENTVRIFGSAGQILINDPWTPNRDGGEVTMIVTRNGQKEPMHVTVSAPPLYAIEADAVAQYLKDRQATSPAMSWDDTLGNMRTLDAWRKQIKLEYNIEKPERVTHTVSHRPLVVRPKHNMKCAKVAGLKKPVSRLVMGVDNQDAMPHAAIMFDDFFERGGNCFDTAWIYGAVRSRLLGQWMKNRDVRNQCAVIVKGGHTPLCDPKSVVKQLHESLDLLQIDQADIYMMHRDNLEIPVSEFIDVLNEQKRAGRIAAFGGSNWSTARVDDANTYANSKGLTGFTVVSNNFSLARMVDAPWPGCVTSSDADSRDWFKRTQIPLLAWSSQARGFFLPGRADPADRSDAELTRCWYSDDNFQRLHRVNEMAKRRNVLPINIALAYVLAQPFPTFGLIGPRQLSETRTSFAALDIELTPDEVRWLNLE